MIKVKLIASNTDIELEIAGHATYGDAPAGDELTYKKVCACVTLIALSISDYLFRNDIGHVIDKGILKVSISKDKFSETLNAYVNQLCMLNGITKNRYLDIELKGEKLCQ